MFLASPTQSDESVNCKCWEDFEPEKEGEEWFCRGKKNHRIFGCNEEKPPLCICKENGGVDVTLDLGEINCISIEDPKKYKSINCEPKNEWEEYLKKHPEKRIYH